jgi:NodT family efflux transporter outer membrane factor (OMF) lipoprotein
MNDRGRLFALAACLALLPAGCTVGPDFERPTPPQAPGYLPAGENAGSAANAQRIAVGERIPTLWWELFHSPRLDEILRQAIADSYSLAAARATLLAAQEDVLVARAAFYPQVDFGAGFRRSKSVSGGVTSNLFSLGPTVSYSIDAFGGTRRRVEQQSALADNQQYELAAAYLILTGSCVTEAIAIASTRLEIATVEDLIKQDEKNLDLTEKAFKAGRVARADVLTAAAQLESDRTQLPALHQQLAVARHTLATLAGRAPAEWSPPELELSELTLPDDLPVSLPSQLVRQRPDILAAETLLHADSAAIGVATAQMYPSITLSASLLQEAQTFGTLFQSASTLWDVAAGASTPVFHGGALASQKRAAVDAYNAQLATYQQTVVDAFGQVANALAALEHDADMVAASEHAVAIASESLKLQRSSYAAGKTSALQLIVAEDVYSNVRLGYVRALGQRLSDTAQLFIAVGGGWSQPGPD